MSGVAEPMPPYAAVATAQAQRVLDYGDRFGLALYIGLLAFELAVLAALCATVHYIARSEPGSSDPDSVQQVWLRMPEIRLQPVAQPFLLAIGVAIGAHTALDELTGAAADVLGLEPDGDVLFSIIQANSDYVSAFLTTFVYRVSGGRHWVLCAVVASALVRIAPMHVFDPVGVARFVVVRMPFHILAALQPLPPVAKALNAAGSRAAVNVSGVDATLAVVAGPLALLFLLGVYLNEFLRGSPSYIFTLVCGLEPILLASASAIASAFTVKRAVLRHQFQWQWRAFLTPAIVLTALYLALCVVPAGGGTICDFSRPRLILGFAMHGVCGLLGGALYLQFAEKCARAEAAKLETGDL